MVSIIIPIYNVEAYLDACVASALQLSTAAEVLLVDDGSTDGSGALCDGWAQKDSRVRVIHRENGGLSAARNSGIQAARGSHVLFLDADDLLDSAETDRMLSHLTDDTQVLMGLYDNYFAEEDRCEREQCQGFLRLEGTVPTRQFLQAVPRDGASCYMTAWRFVCRRDFLLENDLLFLPGIYHEDEEWTQRLLCAASHVTVTHCVFYKYRQAREGAITSHVKAKHLLDSCRIICLARSLEEKHPQHSGYLRQRMGMLYLNGLIHAQSMGADKKEIMAQLRSLRSCARYMTGRIGTPARLCVAVLGVGMTAKLLALAQRIVK